MKKGWKIFWTVIISLTGAGVVFCIIALCLGVTFSQFEKAYPNGIGIIRKDYVSFEGDWDDDDDDDEPEETENVVSERIMFLSMTIGMMMMSWMIQKMLYRKRHFPVWRI